MTQVMTDLMAGRLSAADISDFLTTLAQRGETAEEIAAAVEVLRARAVPLPLTNTNALCDTCGTGGDQQGTINVSTLAALVAAAAGVRIVKHGNRAASSRCGSADLMEVLGVNLEASPSAIARCVETLGFGFCFAQRFHPAMQSVAPIRKALGIRTLFNLVGPLANPAQLTFQLVGVSDARLLQPMADALKQLGIHHGMVVHGRDGLDEITTTTVTDCIELRDGTFTTQTIDPRACGITYATRDALHGGDVPRNAQLAHEVLEGRAGALQDIVLLNAGCVVYVADQASTMAEGIRKARTALCEGAARQLIDRVKELTRAA